MNRMLIKMKLSTDVTLPDAFPSNLLTVVYWKMKFPSFDWFNGHGISTIIPSPRNGRRCKIRILLILAK